MRERNNSSKERSPFIRRAWLLVFGGLSVMTWLSLASCSDSTSPDPQPATISGTVINSAGDPVAGASILVSFRPSFDDIMQPKKEGIAKDLPPGEAIFWLKITDACGDTIRTLCDSGCTKPGSLTWNGLDDAGLRVVEGLYKYVLATADSLISHDLVLIHGYHDWLPQEGGHHTLTDAGGRYHLADECLGFGHLVTTTDEEGNIIDERPIQRLVNLRAVDAAGNTVGDISSNVARRDSVLFPADGNLEVNFVIED